MKLRGEGWAAYIFFYPKCLQLTLGGDIISQVAKGTLQ